MKPQVEIYDTTLRDGSQGEGINFSVADKLRIAEKLDAFGVHYIEGGWPGSNPKDIEFFAQAKRKKFKNARLAAFGSTRKKGVPVEQDDQVRLLIEAETPVVTIFGKTSMLHVKEVLRCTPEENLAMIADTVKFLKDHGKFVVYDAEHCFDGYKLDPEYAVATWQAAEKAGADFIVLCDTNGGCLPGEVAEITKAAVGKLNCKVGIHTHDDIGLGAANALASLDAGAIHVQGTINGYGERTGNCNLTSVIPCIALKMKKTCVPEKSLPKLKELSQFVDEIANSRHNPRQPWVGSSAFAHKGGAHVNAVQKLAPATSTLTPRSSATSAPCSSATSPGRSNIVMKAQELGFKLTNETPELKAILNRVKELEHDGYEFEAAEASLALLIGKTLKQREPPFTRGYLSRFHAPRRQGIRLRGDRPGPRRRESASRGCRRRRPGERAGCRAARRAREVFPEAQKNHAHGLQGPHPRRRHRHRRENARAHRVHRRQARMGHRRRERKHHRSQPPGAGGLAWNTRC